MSLETEEEKKREENALKCTQIRKQTRKSP